MTETPRLQRRVYVKTYGCQMNVYDSERMADALAPAGYAVVDTPESADLILLNTCHIREKAAEKVYSDLGRLRRLKTEGALAGRQVLIGVTGCVAQAEGDEIMRRAPMVDLVVGPQSYQRLPGLVAAAARGERAVETEFATAEKFAALARPGPAAAARRYTAFLTVQEGCDKFCTFCVVPYTRGGEVSRPFDAVIAEATRLAAEGVRELTLLGQNVNAWRGEAAGRAIGLGDLLFRLADIPGIDRLRYTTSHPRDMDDSLIAAHRDLDALMPYLHLPVQSGSDRILAAMNRRHRRSDYLAAVDRVRAVRPDLALAGDFIVGFPGETDADFEDTLSIVDEADYAAAFFFKYSPRPGTPAASLAGQVPEPVKAERLERLKGLIEERQRAFARARIGEVAEVLFERSGRHAGQLAGRSPWLLPIQVEAGPNLIGTIARVRIDRAGSNSLFGSLVGAASPARMETSA